MKTAPLNIFQRLVRHWDTVHPYNAAQVLKIRGPGNHLQVQQAWHDTLAALGLGPVCITGRRYRYESVNGDVAEHAVSALNGQTNLESYLTGELNRRFTSGELPMRPFMLQRDGYYYLGLVYQHWIADSVSIRLLLKEWFLRLYDHSESRRLPVIIPQGGYWKFFGPHRSRWRLGEQILTFLRANTQFRRVRKLQTLGSTDFSMQFALHRVPAGLIQRLLRAARAQGATLNDLFVAAMARVCDKHLPFRYSPQRQDMALGLIVDLRARSAACLHDAFGLFLGFVSVICRRRDLYQWPRLVKAIAAQTKKQKHTDEARASVVWMCAALAASRFVPKRKTFRFYRKHMPLAGGISNVNLNTCWAHRYHPDPLMEYIRVSPTGPMVPLVFTTTTLGEDFHFGLTYRRSLIADQTAQMIAGEFVQHLQELADSRHEPGHRIQE